MSVVHIAVAVLREWHGMKRMGLFYVGHLLSEKVWQQPKSIALQTISISLYAQIGAAGDSNLVGRNSRLKYFYDIIVFF